MSTSNRLRGVFGGFVSGNFTLMDFQEKTINYGVKNKYSIYALQMGLGKAQPLDSKVLTSKGFVNMGDISVGDFVIGRDGKPKKVTGVYPQGVKQVYEILFTDNTTVRCCEDHLWSVRTPNDEYSGRDFRVLPLKDISKNLKQGSNLRWKIPIVEPVEFPESSHLIPPYVLGVLIGDGGLSHSTATITNSSEFIFNRLKKECSTIEDVEVVSYDKGNTNTINIRRKSARTRFNPVVSEIARLGLNKKSVDKFIPESYKIDSVENRVKLLQGLLDTDGYVAKDGCLQFCSASEKLVNDFIEVLQSLGGVCTGIKYKKTNMGTDAWFITLKQPKDIVLVTKPEKAERLQTDRKYLPSRLIKDVRKLGLEECQCISVEGEHYITDNFVVTHNTLCALETARRTKSKTLIVCPPFLILNWKQEIKKFFPNANVSVLKHKREYFFPIDDHFVVISNSFLKEADVLFEWADMVIVDEAHEYKNMSAKRTEALHKLVYENSIKRLLLLTGTPILNRVYELHSLLSLMEYNPEKTESAFLNKFKTYVDFANHFSFLEEKEITRGKRRVRIQQWSGLKNKPELMDILSKCMIRFKSEDVLTLPKFEDDFVHVDDIDMPELKEAFDSFLSNPENHSVQSAIKARAAALKAPLTAQYVQSLVESGYQVVVFSAHVEAAEIIAEALGIKAITGSTTVEWRMRQANAFQSGDQDAIVGTIGAFSTGFNLQNAHVMVFNDIEWVPGKNEQAKFRILRVGQKNKCLFRYMIGSFQDEYIYGKVLDKEGTIKEVMG